MTAIVKEEKKQRLKHVCIEKYAINEMIFYHGFAVGR